MNEMIEEIKAQEAMNHASNDFNDILDGDQVLPHPSNCLNLIFTSKLLSV